MEEKIASLQEEIKSINAQVSGKVALAKASLEESISKLKEELSAEKSAVPQKIEDAKQGCKDP